MTNLEEAKSFALAQVETLAHDYTFYEVVHKAQKFIITLCAEVESLRATLALNLGVAEDDPVITENKLLQERKTLRQLCKKQKEYIGLLEEEAGRLRKAIKQLRRIVSETRKVIIEGSSGIEIRYNLDRAFKVFKELEGHDEK